MLFMCIISLSPFSGKHFNVDSIPPAGGSFTLVSVSGIGAISPLIPDFSLLFACFHDKIQLVGLGEEYA